MRSFHPSLVAISLLSLLDSLREIPSHELGSIELCDQKETDEKEPTSRNSVSTSCLVYRIIKVPSSSVNIKRRGKTSLKGTPPSDGLMGKRTSRHM